MPSETDFGLSSRVIVTVCDLKEELVGISRRLYYSEDSASC